MGPARLTIRQWLFVRQVNQSVLKTGSGKVEYQESRNNAG